MLCVQLIPTIFPKIKQNAAKTSTSNFSPIRLPNPGSPFFVCHCLFHSFPFSRFLLFISLARLQIILQLLEIFHSSFTSTSVALCAFLVFLEFLPKHTFHYLSSLSLLLQPDFVFAVPITTQLLHHQWQ